jgi:hypothetical protein
MVPVYILCMIHSRLLIGRKAQWMHVRGREQRVSWRGTRRAGMGTWRKYTAELLQRVQTGGQGLEISVWPPSRSPAFRDDRCRRRC